MPYVEIGREITRGTICRDRWRADVVIACPDVIPPSGTAPLALTIRWRALGDGGGPERPEDASGISLRLRKASDASPGEVRFDGPAGDLERHFTEDVDALLQLHGVSESAATEPDVVLEVSIEGQVRATLPIMVRDPGRTIRILTGSGGRPPPEIIPAERRILLRAGHSPEVAGTIRWMTLGGDALRIEGERSGNEVVIVGREGGQGELALCAIHIPDNDGPAVMAAHRVAVLAGASIEAPDDVHIGDTTVIAAGWSHASAPAGTEVEMIALVDGGIPGQRITFEISGIIGFGSTGVLERVDVPLGEGDLVRVPWTIPARLPGVPVRALGFTVSAGNATVPSGTHHAGDGTPDLHHELSLRTSVEITLTDSLGSPLAGIAYELQQNGVTLMGGGGVTGPNGEITVPDLQSDEYTLVLRDAVVLDAAEPDVEPRIPSSENTVFSLVDVRPGPSGEAAP